LATLITGIGLVGTSFAQQALERNEDLTFLDFQDRSDYLAARLPGRDVRVVQRDIRDLPSLVEAMQLHGIDTVVHTASLIADKVSDPLYTGLQVNVLGTLNVLEAIRLTGVKRLVHMSTFGVYDGRRSVPGPVQETAPRGPGRAYGNSKTMQELLAETYQLQYGFELVVLRMANVYGFGHFWGGSGGEKIQRLLEAGISGTTAVIPEHQTMPFEYVYSRDVGRAIDLAATTPLRAETVFNIGSGTVTTFGELVSQARHLYPKLEVDVVPTGPPAVASQYPLNLARAQRFLAWQPEYDLQNGLRTYAAELEALPRASQRMPHPAR
jgi:nucleoside-diphosphate-sugar epimerase